MNELSVIANPLGAAQTRLLCSPTRHLQVALAYPLISGFIAMIIFRAAQPMSLSQLAMGALPVLLVATSALLAFVAGAAIRRSVLRDFTTGMIDSHRLSAMSGSTLVLGYLTGPTSQAVILAVENYLMGLVACAFMPQHPWLEWTVANGIVACAAFPIWAASVLLAVATQGRGSLGGLLFAFGILGGYAVFRIIPAFILILGPLILFTKINSIAVGVTPPATLFLGLPFQLVIGVTLCVAAARKVRRADVQAFGYCLGIILLLEIALAGLLGLYCADELVSATPIRDWRNVSKELLFLATWIMLAIFSFVPISAAAQALSRWRRRRALDVEFADPAPAGLLPVVAFAMLVLLVPVAIDQSFYAEIVLDPPKVVGCLMLGVLCMAGFFRWSYARREKIFVVGLIFFLLMWVLPVVAEIAWNVYAETGEISNDVMVFTPLIAFSPAGAAYAVLSGATTTLWPGLAFQAVITALFWLPRRRRIPQPVIS